MDTNCVQIASKTQRQPYVEVSEVYLHIHSFILVYFDLNTELGLPVVDRWAIIFENVINHLQL